MLISLLFSVDQASRFEEDEVDAFKKIVAYRVDNSKFTAHLGKRFR